MFAVGVGEVLANLFIVALVGVMMAVTLANRRAAQRRRAELLAFARGCGFTLIAYPGSVHNRYREFVPLNRGHRRKSVNLIHGERNGIQWEMFDFRYKPSDGRNTQMGYLGIVAAHIACRLPKLRIRPEGPLEKLAEAAGFDDINFESHEFSRRYHVTCDDRKRAYDLLHPQMIEYMLTLPRYDWQLAGPVILIWNSRRYKPPELEQVMSAIEGFVQRIPEYVRQDIGVA